MRHDYKDEKWETVEVKGVKCLFCDIRIDRNTIPEGMIMYEVADNDSDGTPCRMRPGILVNFFGTILSNHRFEPDEGDTKGFKEGNQFETLLGVTGSGKTFTMANVIAQLNKPTIVIAHNKTLEVRLYSEFKEFFPENAVEYFVS